MTRKKGQRLRFTITTPVPGSITVPAFSVSQSKITSSIALGWQLCIMLLESWSFARLVR